MKIVGPNEVVVEEFYPASLKPDEVLVNMHYCGICGSDLHAYQGRHPYISLPATPGHEGSGIIAQVGSAVSTLQVGDQVTFEPNLNCGTCYNCIVGRYNICENLRVMGCQAEGMMADVFTDPAHKVVKIPDDMPLRSAALVEPLAVALHAVRKVGVQLGDHVVVLGAGTIGLCVVQCARLAGASVVMATDLVPKRLELAKTLGATHILNPSTQPIPQYLQTNPDVMGFEGVDVAFECVGVGATLDEAIKVARKGSKIAVVGVFGSLVDGFNAGLIQDKEVELVGTLMYTLRDITDAVQLIYQGVVNVEPLITNEFPLEMGIEAFQHAWAGKENEIKVLLKIKATFT